MNTVVVVLATAYFLTGLSAFAYALIVADKERVKPWADVVSAFFLVVAFWPLGLLYAAVQLLEHRTR